MQEQKTIVIVEDDQDNSELLNEVFTEEFSNVLVFNCGLKALENIIKIKPHLILTDVSLPGLSGVEMVKKVREEGITSPVIFQTGHSVLEIEKEINALSKCKIISKPYDFDALLSLAREQI